MNCLHLWTELMDLVPVAGCASREAGQTCTARGGWCCCCYCVLL
jgi:hypothetical protein